MKEKITVSDGQELLNARILDDNSGKTLSFSETQYIWIEYDNNEDDHSNRKAFPDFDLFTLLLNDQGKVNTESDLLFYNNTVNDSHSVMARGDAIGDFDAKYDGVYIDFSKIPAEINQIVIFANRFLQDDEIDDYQVYSRPVEKLIIRDVKDGRNRRLISTIEFEREDYKTDVTHLCSITRNGSKWTLQIISEGLHSSLRDLLRSFGAKGL